jgi:eukaryotic-like serine/threonine-protein kinase
MDSTRWQRVQDLFHDASELAPPDQQAFLKSRCSDDPTLIEEVAILLEEDARGGSLLDNGVARVAYEMFEESRDGSPPHKQFGPYRILKTLGEGGMGIVYLAEREDLGSKVAIKILRDAWLSPARRSLFAAEQRTLAQLTHPSIARLYDANASPDGSPFFVMEYVEGVPLTVYCEQHKCSMEERLKIFRAVCDAVLYAHQHAVIHRDLKPSNVLVKDDGTVRLLDFGISKHLENTGDPANYTMTGFRMMTPAYAAPEQIRGEQVGIQSDVYSLGVILYELLAGRVPFDLTGQSPAQAQAILTEREPDKPSAVAERLAQTPERKALVAAASKSAWADLNVLCLTAMHKDAQRRYQSVDALIRDIDHYLKAEPLDAQADTVGYRLRKFVTRNREEVLAASVMALIVLGLVIFFTVRLAIARNEALAEAARAQRIEKFMTNLFQGGDASAGPADNLRVVTLLDRGVQEAQSLRTEPGVQAQLYETLGTMYQKLGKLDQADSLLNLALKERKIVYGDDSPEVAETLVTLGLLRDDQAQLPEAERLVRVGLAMSKRRLLPNHPSIAKATASLGKVLEDRGSYDEAIKTLEQAVQLQSTKGPTTPELATTLYELANTHFYAGHYDTSQSINERLLPLCREIYGERHPRVADVLVNLGAIKFDLGHYAEAEKFDRQALDIVEGWYGKDNPETASDLTLVGRSLVFQGRLDEAIEPLQRSLAINERVYGKVNPTVASALNELGNAASKKGDYDAAEQYFTRMIDIYRQVYGDHHYLVAVATSNLGSVYMGRQDWPKAEQIFRQAVSLFTETQSATHVNTGIARIKLGRTLVRQHRYSEAAAETQAGYDILIKQMDPKVTWLVSARKDLVEDYDALHQPEKSAKIRTEIAALETKTPTAVAKH